MRIAIFRAPILGLAVIVLAAGCAQDPTATPPPTAKPTQSASPVPPPIPACSTIAIPTATASPNLLIMPPATSGTTTVTSADSRATVFLIPAQHLIVEVGFPGPPAWSGTPRGADIFWTPPDSPHPGPLYRSGTASCSGGSAVAVFTAVGTGGTTVNATTDAPCFHTQPVCEMAQQGFEIYVVVRPAL